MQELSKKNESILIADVAQECGFSPDTVSVHIIELANLEFIDVLGCKIGYVKLTLTGKLANMP